MTWNQVKRKNYSSSQLSSPFTRKYIMPDIIGARKEKNINIKYHLGTFERSIHSTTKDIKNMNSATEDRIAVIKAAT